MPRLSDRRDFLRHAAALGAAGAASPLLAAENAKKLPPSERLSVGVIGLGNRGSENWREVAATGAQIVAVCDVDEQLAAPARKKFPAAKFYRDFRQLLDARGIDAVVVSTADHTHAPASLAALRAGLHVYCEKPLTHSVSEARAVADAARKHNRVTQMGTQIHAGENYRRVVEVIRAGAIGPVTEAHSWVSAGWYGGDRPKDTPPVPANFDYDLWLGPAPKRPYHSSYHPANWRRWWDFGGGTLGDMGCHHVDLIFWALGLRHPTRVVAESPVKPHPETAPKLLTVHYDFPARGDAPPVKVTWHSNGQPRQFQDHKLPKWGNGTLFVGTKGMLLADYGKYVLLPEDRFEDYTRPGPSIPASVGHHKEWVEACKSGGPTTCNFDYSGALTETILLGNVAFRLGRPVEWDADNLKARNDSAADEFLRREYRKGWEM